MKARVKSRPALKRKSVRPVRKVAKRKHAKANSSRSASKKPARPAAKKHRRNPEDSAAARYRLFHGRDPDQVIDVTETLHEHAVLSGIGKLVSLSVASISNPRQVVELSGFRGALLSQDEKGRQLFIKGGDQSVDVRQFGITRPHEQEVLGAVLAVAYDTQKDHLRPEDGGKAIYDHQFGDGGSRLPLLIYDAVNKSLLFAGGGYTLPEVGIRG